MAAPVTVPLRRMLEHTVGERETVAGTIAVVVDESGTSRVAYGSSGVAGVALDASSVSEIGSMALPCSASRLPVARARLTSNSCSKAREWERGTMELLLSTPVTPMEPMVGKLVPYFAIGLLDECMRSGPAST